MDKVVVITSQNMASNNIVAGLIDVLGSQISLIVGVPNLPSNSRKSIIRTFSLLRRASFFFAFFKFCEIYIHGFLATLQGRNIKQLAKEKDIPFRRFSSANEEALFEQLSKAPPCLILSAGPVILPRRLINLPMVATLNCHCARLPDYRGAANYIWMKINNENEAYATIQRMEFELDAGAVIDERAIGIDPSWSAYQLNYHLSSFAGRFYGTTVRKILESRPSQLTYCPTTQRKAGNRGIPNHAAMLQFMKNHRLLSASEIFRCV